MSTTSNAIGMRAGKGLDADPRADFTTANTNSLTRTTQLLTMATATPIPNPVNGTAPKAATKSSSFLANFDLWRRTSNTKIPTPSTRKFASTERIAPGSAKTNRTSLTKLKRDDAPPFAKAAEPTPNDGRPSTSSSSSGRSSKDRIIGSAPCRLPVPSAAARMPVPGIGGNQSIFNRALDRFRFNKFSGAVPKPSDEVERAAAAEVAGSKDAKPVAGPSSSGTKAPVNPDIERNSRHADVVALITGTFRLKSKFGDRYKIGELLGDGAFGFVFTARRLKDNKEVGHICSLHHTMRETDLISLEQVAVKFIVKHKIPDSLWVEDPYDVKAPKVPREICYLMTLRHPTLISYLDHYADEERYFLLVTELHGTEWDVENPALSPERNPGLRVSKKQGIVLEELDEEARKVYEAQKAELSPLLRLTPDQEKAIRRRTSCDLFECIDAHRRIPESTGKRIFAQIALGVDHLHRNNVVHRDLKDENIVINADYVVKIIDFGSASPIPTSEANYFRRFNGTAHFASPEVSKGKAFRGPEAEIWTLGVLLHTIIYGENPFQNKADIIKGTFRFPFRVDSDDDPEGGVKSLIKRMLCYNVDERANMEEVLSHPWIRGEVERYRSQWE
ncbi:hypothetical protein HK101_000613 [Irineochytrium annulatum]|nr:hypothetical protein HK101_000613 [Irineochytrium annulatum]